jgi:hypothetical protein
VVVKLKLSFSGSEVIQQSADKLMGVTKKKCPLVRRCGVGVTTADKLEQVE